MAAVLTIEPFGVVFKRPFKREFTSSSRQVVQVSAEDHGVSFRELSVGAGVEGGQRARVPALHPQRRRVIRRVVRTLRDAHTDAWHVLVTGQVCQVRLQQTIPFTFIPFPNVLSDTQRKRLL